MKFHSLSPFSHLIAVIVILLIGVFYFSSIRTGHGWGDDFAQYVQEAKDISQGVSYTRSNYIFNPQNPGVGPETYPPGYPLLLAPIYAHWGMNFAAMKVENILFFFGFLSLFYMLIRKELPTFPTIVALVIVGLNPVLWGYKDNVGSEMAFVFFLFLFFYVIQSPSVMENRHFSISCFAIGLLLFFTYEIRTFGVLLLPAMIVCETWRKRALSWSSVVVTLFFVCFYAAQALLTSGSHGYWELIRASTFSFSLILQSARDYGRELSHFWGNGYSKLFRAAIFIPSLLLACFGFWQQVRTRLTTLEIYAPLHLGVTIMWPYTEGVRFLIPIFPLYVFYCLLGLRELCVRLSFKRCEQFSPLVFLILVAASYAGTYERLDFRTVPSGFGNPKCLEFFKFVKEDTESASIFIFRKPRALGFFAERRTSVYPATGSDDELWNYITNVHASYLVKSPIDDPIWGEFLNRNRSRMTVAYSNGEFEVYKIPTFTSTNP
jgi:hypothetical protein